MPRRGLLVLAAVVLVASSGCLGYFGNGETPEPEDVRDSSIEATEELTTYSFEVDTTVDAKLLEDQNTTEDDGPEITVFYRSEGKTDAEERAMRIESQSTTQMEVGTQQTEATVYLGDGSLFVDSGDGWERSNTTDFGSIWQAHDVARSTAETLDAEVSFANDETVTVRGREAYAVSADEHGDEYAEAVLERVRLYAQTEPDGGMEVTDAEIRESSATVWVDAENGYPLKAESETVFDAVLETGAGEAETRLSVESETEILDHNEPIELEKPEPQDGSGLFPPLP
jgi:hypothetical protein